MNTYLVARWGNVKDGPNGQDTIFMVLAETPSEAGNLADAALADHPECNGPNVRDWCSCVVALGPSLSPGPAGVIHGPWIAHIILRGQDETLPSWHRDVSRVEPWSTREEYFPAG